MKIKKNTLFYTLITGCILAASLGLVFNKWMTKDDSSVIIEEEGDNNNDLYLNITKIKSKKIGDEFEIKANINTDATFQSCTFLVSDETALGIVSRTKTSITVKRLKDFEGIVTITAISDDPFSDLEDTCEVRCYNNFKEFYYFIVNEIYDATKTYTELKKLCSEDEIILKQGLTYKCSIVCSSLFSYLNDEDGYEGDTNIFLEEEDFLDIITQFELIFNNKIISYSQDDTETDSNRIKITFMYENTITFSSNKISKFITCNGENLNLELTNYVEVSNFLLNNEETIVI